MIATLKNIWNNANAHKGMRFSLCILFVWLFVALCAPVIESWFGLGYANLQPEHGLLPPLSQNDGSYYILGTDYLGRDLLSGMIHGARVAFVVAFVSVCLSLLLGLSVGLIIGFYRDNGIRKNLLQQLTIYILIIVELYYIISMMKEGLNRYNIVPFLGLLVLGIGLEKAFAVLPIKKYGVPLDIIMQRLFELREGLPGLFIILSIAAIVSSPSIYSVALIISILYWMTFARHARAETMHIKEEDYIMSAHSSGISDMRLLYYHILPNAMPSIFVIIAFTFGAVILLESSLSFLGIGLPVEEVSWGKILAGARRSPKAWWLAVFPGMAIFLVLFAFNNLADFFAQYQRRIDANENI